MMVNEYFNLFMQKMFFYCHEYLILIMGALFLMAALGRWAIYYLLISQERLCVEFEKRVHRHVDEGTRETQDMDFSEMVKFLFEKTHHEIYLLRGRYRRRRFDLFNHLFDTVFGVPSSSTEVVMDTQRQLRFYSKNDRPNFLDISMHVFSTNKGFKKIFGFLSISFFHRVLDILPGIFILLGIFGTFGEMAQQIPPLKNIDPSQVVEGKMILGHFLDSMMHSMNLLLLSILLSAGISLVNSAFSPQETFTLFVERFQNCLEILWINYQELEKIRIQNLGNAESAENLEEREKAEDDGPLVAPDLPDMEIEEGEPVDPNAPSPFAKGFSKRQKNFGPRSGETPPLDQTMNLDGLEEGSVLRPFRPFRKMGQ